MQCVFTFLLVLVMFPVTVQAKSPSFDCSKARSSAEKLVCEDDELASLDLEVARLFELALDGKSMTSERRKLLIATQRGWVKGRDDCWKASNLRDCVFSNYVIRIHELRQGYADARGEDDKGISKGPLALTCRNFNAGIAVTFIRINQPVAYMEWKDKSIIMRSALSGSGSRYTVKGEDGDYELWIKGDSATYKMPGRKTMECMFSEVN